MLKLNFYLLVVGYTAAGSDPVVQISNGKVLGKTLTTLNNKTFYAFQGIPFAKPPVDELRFQPPQRPDNWEGILDDRNANKICIQKSSTLATHESEDCLYLNVYTPQLPTEDQNVSLPILFVIHGGGFVCLSASIDDFGPHFLLDHKVIMVTVQYRLGFHGFLSTGDLVCPGNNGFKDQQFGLRWVQENIEHFGGDPSKVTIFGGSAGAACIGYQLLGEHAEGLFRGAIQNSGTSLGAWALQKNPRDIAFKFASYLNPAIKESNTTSQELINFFNTVEISRIKKAVVDIFGESFLDGFYNTLDGFAFSGVIEPEHENAFLTDSAYKKFESGNFNIVPTLIGINSEEARFLLFDSTLDQRLKSYDEHNELLVSWDMHITNETIRRQVGQEIREMYVGNGQLYDNKGSSIKYFSDTTFVRPIIKQAKLESKYTNVYFYEFAYSGKLGRENAPLIEIPGLDKVNHGEEMPYLFHKNTTKEIDTFPKEDILTMNRMVTMWTNFVKYLNPTPEPQEILQNVKWPEIFPTGDEMPYLFINDTLEVRFNVKKSMADAYQHLYELYSNPPLNTY